MNKVIKFLRENKILIFAYFFSALFFIYQHYKILNWDFITYILNAKYLFSQGNYFEWIREPLTPFLIGIFSVFTWKLAPYFYIILTSSLHLYASIKLSNRFNINKNVYYLISLCPFLLLDGLINGTELLFLSFIELFLAYFNYNISAVFFALAFLSRYTALGLFPLIIFLGKIKKILIFIIIFLIIVSPWLIFNYIKTGNVLLSIADTYALNITFRDYINDKFPFFGIILTLNYLLIFFILGFYKKIKNLNKYDYIMLSIIILTLFSFYRIPVKSYTIRYIFLIIIPLSYFSAIALEKIKKQFIILLFLISIIISFYFISNQYHDDIKNYKESLPYLNNCSTYSNNWVYLNYLGKNVQPDLYKEQFKSKLEKGYRILMFYNNPENLYIKDENFLKDLPVIEKNDKFILFGNKNKCIQDGEKIDTPYIINKRESVKEVYGYDEDISNCYIFFKKKIPLIC
jgi:hypothetical protein